MAIPYARIYLQVSHIEHTLSSMAVKTPVERPKRTLSGPKRPKTRFKLRGYDRTVFRKAK